MHSMARQLMAMFESFESLDFNQAPNVRFMDALRTKLNEACNTETAIALDRRLSIKDVDQIVGSMTIDLDGDMIDDEFIDSTTSSLAIIVVRIHQMFVEKRYWNPAEMTILMSKQFTVKCK